jgi:rhodanese-related sulfurtransferase
MNKSTLILDIRDYNEINEKHLNNNFNVLYIPANMIKYNVSFLLKVFEKYDEVKIMCRSRHRSKIIKNKYFKNYDKVQVNKVQFKDLEEDIIKTNGLHMNFTRKIQLIIGIIILLLFLLTYYYKKAIYGFLLLGLMLLFVSLTGYCFLSKLLVSNDY